MKLKLTPILMVCLAVLTTTTAYAAEYSDIAGHPDASYIQEYSEQGLVNGYPDGTFLPNSPITRAEVAALVNRLDLPAVNQKTGNFSDVPAHEWYYDIIKNTVKTGLVSGYEDNTFQPQKNITRFEAISIVSRLIEGEGADRVKLSYQDSASIPAWVSPSVKNLYAAGIIDGYDGNAINGNAVITRSEMVRMLDKVMRTYDFDTDQITVVQTSTKETSDKKKTEAVVQNTNIPHDILGYLTINSIGIKDFPVKDGADLETIKTAIGHFAETPLWNGNVGFCAHNRDYKYDFRNLKNIEKGDTVVYETRFGTRTYVVNEIEAIAETDWTDLLEENERNTVTMITCIEDKPTQRLMVQAVEK